MLANAARVRASSSTARGWHSRADDRVAMVLDTMEEFSRGEDIARINELLANAGGKQAHINAILANASIKNPALVDELVANAGGKDIARVNELVAQHATEIARISAPIAGGRERRAKARNRD